MSAEPVLIPLAICEMCWLEEHAKWEPESMNESGNILMRLAGVDMPEIVEVGSVEICCQCGSITIAGIYNMMNPLEVYFINGDKASHDFEFDFSETDEE
jgi:hypothetical protein